jgi:hypothetical protein
MIEYAMQARKVIEASELPDIGRYNSMNNIALDSLRQIQHNYIKGLNVLVPNLK